MSRIYQIFFEETVDSDELHNLVEGLGGCVSGKDRFTIEGKNKCVWIFCDGEELDGDYFQTEITEIKQQFGFDVRYCIDIELSSEKDSKQLALEFYKKFKDIVRQTVLLDQNGKYYTDLE